MEESRIGTLRRLNLRVAFQGESVPIVDSVKFLEVIFDGNLSWVAHAKQVSQASNNKINVMRSIAGLSSHPDTLLSVYKGWIKAPLDYGCIAFVDVEQNAAKILDSIQFRALRIVLSLFVSTPTNVILHLTGEMPLRIRRRLLTDRKVIKWLNPQKDEPLLLSLLDRPNYGRSVSALALESHLVDSLMSRRANCEMFAENGSASFSEVSYFSYFVELSVDTRSCVALLDKVGNDADNKFHMNKEVILKNILINNGFGDAIPFYTDRSRIPKRGVGCGVFSREKDINIKFSLSKFLNIYDAEAIAILHALRCILNLGVKKSVIMSDSLSVLFSLGSPAAPGRLHCLITAIRQIVWTMSEDGFMVHFLWIPGHAGIFENEAADFLARKGADVVDIAGVHSLFCFPENLFPELKRNAEEASLRELREDAVHKGYRYFNRARSRGNSPWFRVFPNLPRSTVVLISRMRSFHVNLPYHLHDKNFVDSPSCECGAIGTIQLAFECELRGDSCLSLARGLASASQVYNGNNILDVVFEENRAAWLLLDRFRRKTSLRI